MAIVQKSDFKNQYKISTSRFTGTELDEYIDRYEEFYLVKLFGADLYDLFVADLTGTTPQVPQTQIYLDVFNPFNIDDESCLHESVGIKKMLIKFIYFHFVRDMSHYNTTAGTVTNDNENSKQSLYNGFNLLEAYNEGVETFNEIQWYIDKHIEDYPDENMQLLNYASGI
jgi:hypothetical protein